MKAWYGLLQDMKVVDLNRLLKPHGVRLVVKKSKEFGKNVCITTQTIGTTAKRTRAPKPATSPQPPLSSEFVGGSPS